jgi:hypothetical protein
MTEPRTAAGQALLDMLNLRWVDEPTNRGMADREYVHAILAIEAEASRIDVERLARALQHSNHGTRCRDKYGAAYTFDELSDEGRRSMRDDADNIAVAYEAEP